MFMHTLPAKDVATTAQTFEYSMYLYKQVIITLRSSTRQLS